MSGIGNRTAGVSATGDARIDGILRDAQWIDTTVSYSFPSGNAEYTANYGEGEAGGLFALSPAMKRAAHFALRADYGSAANDGFSIGGFTGQRIKYTSLENANLRLAQTSLDPYGYTTAWGYFPSGGATGGDVWLTNKAFDYSAPRAGNYAHLTLIHEIGHAMGLEHAHTDSSYGAVPAHYDAMEYTVMSYRSHVGGGTDGYTNEKWGFAQSYMMLDIAALQHMYGADFTTNSGDTVYSWDPSSGATRVNGEAAILPGANRVFATIWDGGGTDTYDLSAYRTDLQIDLGPGGASLFSGAQLARLGTADHAGGNIYNALQYRNDSRSLIENATGGSGNDLLRGNRADNHLRGQRGDDRLWGGAGDDRLDGNAGAETLHGGSGDDDLNGGAGNDALLGGGGNDDLNGGTGIDRLNGGGGLDRLHGGGGDDVLVGGAGQDRLSGQAGDDRLAGGAHRDFLLGGAGADILIGGAGRDVFRFASASDSPHGAPFDRILDFTSGEDLIDLSQLSAGAFTIAFGGTFSGHGPHVSLRPIGGDVRVFADTDGDGTADFRVDLENTPAVVPTDFML